MCCAATRAARARCCPPARSARCSRSAPTREINCPSENPLLALDGTAAYHHGGFFAAPLGHALETVNLTLLQTAQIASARLNETCDPALTGV
ncbi:aromatic amino acid lyase, partial [Streptomyces bobili]|uniref:aromatic amino acid lyase n=1 Tax=Streptomyces bobili TaxID=67280 RepID=UPI00344A9908